jgi:hypothetical protein
MTAFKKLRKTRILLSKPEERESVIELTEKDKQALEDELKKKWSRLEVYAVGNGVEDVFSGDLVYVQISALEHAERIEIEGKIKFMVREQDIAIVW